MANDSMWGSTVDDLWGPADNKSWMGQMRNTWSTVMDGSFFAGDEPLTAVGGGAAGLAGKAQQAGGASSTPGPVPYADETSAYEKERARAAATMNHCGQ